ncbi:VRR-NUC domain-containing protein [Xanthomonas campestris pv. cannae]|nr:VRR-NUC domain-containing protein [Xanthomonas campestris pv. cannae]
MSCDHLAAAFVALNSIKRSGLLCKAIGKLEGFDQVCGSKEFSDELDRRALCELFCCCLNSGRQRCVESVLKQADAFHGYKGYYKAEVPYKEREPVMSRREPDRATGRRPGGSRIPDVVVVKDSDLPPTLDNIQKVYEMKFPGDSYSDAIGPDGKTQLEAYKKLFGDKLDSSAMDAESCNCEERKKERILERAEAYEEQRERAVSLVDQVNADAAKAVAIGASATALGRAAEAISGAAAAISRGLGLAF